MEFMNNNLLKIKSMNLFYGILYEIIGQILLFFQLQGNIKYNWFKTHPILLLLLSIPISFTFIKSVDYLAKAYDGEIWPGNLIGFGIGTIIFTLLSWMLYNEEFVFKTAVCILLATLILCIQIFCK